MIPWKTAGNRDSLLELRSFGLLDFVIILYNYHINDSLKTKLQETVGNKDALLELRSVSVSDLVIIQLSLSIIDSYV